MNHTTNAKSQSEFKAKAMQTRQNVRKKFMFSFTSTPDGINVYLLVSFFYQLEVRPQLFKGWITVDSVVCLFNTYPLDSDLYAQDEIRRIRKRKRHRNM